VSFHPNPILLFLLPTLFVVSQLKNIMLSLFLSCVALLATTVRGGTTVNVGHHCSSVGSGFECRNSRAIYSCYASQKTQVNCADTTGKKMCQDSSNGWSSTSCTRVSSPLMYWNCWEGHQWDSSLYCQKCQKGRYRGYNGGGSFSRVHGQQIFCEACPTGKFSDQLGLRVCDDCVPGKYQTSCEQGSVDGVSTNSGCRQCKSCPNGYYQSQNAQADCDQCVAGKYNNLNGQDNENDCTACAAGKNSRKLTNGGGQKETEDIDPRDLFLLLLLVLSL